MEGKARQHDDEISSDGIVGQKVGCGTMNAGSTAVDCLFCQATTSIPDDLEWHDRPLTRIPGVGAVIPGLGAFVPGYVLVFPEQHVESTLRLRGEAGFAFGDLLSQTIRSVTETFGPATVFEHGSCSERNVRRSSCIDHAHTHVIPGIYGLSAFLTEPFSLAVDRQKLTSGTNVGYLLVDEPPYGPQYGLDPGVSQYMRRCIAVKLGIPDEWDYLIFPRLENVAETARALGGRIASAPTIGQSVT
jgi:diadenosine tetraphosphate (Ap4A) HIT family hydrolase